MQKIAIIGSGISGLAASYLLSKNNDITVYEKNDVIGGHTRTVNINHSGQQIAVDTGFIVFNHINYPELKMLFEHLDVKTEKSDMSFGFSMDNGNFEWGASNLNALFGQRSNIYNIEFYRMLIGILKFFKQAPSYILRDSTITLKQLLDELNASQIFRNRFILPMCAAIWSCPASKMLEFPAQTFIQFFQNHGLFSLNNHHQWYFVKNGSQQYVEKIVANFADKIKLSQKVQEIWQDNDKVAVKTISGEIITYDHVIIAAHADESLSLLKDATNEENSILSSFEYQQNIAILHCDEKAMPKRKRCWSSWNYSNNDELSLSYWMNNLQNIDKKYPVFVTLNPNIVIDPNKIFDQHIFDHPIFNNKTMIAQQKISSIQGKRNIWFCGAYQRYGFHEDGLLSAIAVAKALGAKIPWH